MIRLLIFLLVVSGLAYAAYWLANSGGTVAVDWLGYDVTLQVGIALAILAAFVALCVALFELYRYLVLLPKRVGRHRRNKRTVEGYEQLTAGLIAAAAGDASHARAHTRRAEKLLQSNPATLLLTAQTAQLEGKEDVAQLKFQQMLKNPETEFLGLRGLLAEAIKRGDSEEALRLARQAQQKSANTPWVLTTLFDLLTRAERWDEAYTIVGDLQRMKLLRDNEVQRRRGLLRHLMAETALNEERHDDALAHAQRANKQMTAFAPVAVMGARAAMGANNPSAGRKLIERVWKVEPHPELAQAYAELEPNETASARYKRFERLTRVNPRNKISLLALAELAILAKDYPTAKRHLDEAVKLEPSAGVYRLYADYERASGGGQTRAREWLAKAADAAADRAWVCEDTGELLPAWAPFGPSGRFDSVHWDYPPRVAHLIGDTRGALTLTQSAPTAAVEAVAIPPGEAVDRASIKPDGDKGADDEGIDGKRGGDKVGGDKDASSAAPAAKAYPTTPPPAGSAPAAGPPAKQAPAADGRASATQHQASAQVYDRQRNGADAPAEAARSTPSPPNKAPTPAAVKASTPPPAAVKAPTPPAAVKANASGIDPKHAAATTTASTTAAPAPAKIDVAEIDPKHASATTTTDDRHDRGRPAGQNAPVQQAVRAPAPPPPPAAPKGAAALRPADSAVLAAENYAKRVKAGEARAPMDERPGRSLPHGPAGNAAGPPSSQAPATATDDDLNLKVPRPQPDAEGRGRPAAVAKPLPRG